MDDHSGQIILATLILSLVLALAWIGWRHDD